MKNLEMPLQSIIDEMVNIQKCSQNFLYQEDVEINYVEVKCLFVII